MKIYIDLIFLLNVVYDFLILLTVAMTLKRKVTFKSYFLGSLFGGLTTILLFLNINEVLLLILKMLCSVIICLITYKYVSLKYTLNNILYFYMTSIILAGFMYLINNNFNIGVNINYILLLIISPIVLIIYHFSNKRLKTTYNDYYKIKIAFDDDIYELIALFDNGNNLIDPVTKKGIIIVNNKVFNNLYNIRSPVYVPFVTVNGSSIMECFKPSYILINNHKIYNYLIGITDKKFNDGINALLCNKLRKDNYV